MEAKDILATGKSIVEDLNVLSPVRTRVTHRERTLREQSKARHESIPRGSRKEWTTKPPKLALMDLEGGMRGGAGYVTYQKVLVYPKGHDIEAKVGFAIKSPGSGNIPYVFVEEVIELGKPIKTNDTPVHGAPSVEDAIKAWNDHLEEEKRRRTR